MGGETQWLTRYTIVIQRVDQRPARHRRRRDQQKQRQAMISALKNGDRIVTNGGLFATVKDVHEDKVVAFIADGVKVEIAKNAIGGVVQKKD